MPSAARKIGTTTVNSLPHSGLRLPHAGDEGDHQEGLRGEIGVRTVGENGGFVLDFTPVEVQAVLGRTEDLGVVFAVIGQARFRCLW